MIAWNYYWKPTLRSYVNFIFFQWKGNLSYYLPEIQKTSKFYIRKVTFYLPKNGGYKKNKPLPRVSPGTCDLTNLHSPTPTQRLFSTDVNAIKSRPPSRYLKIVKKRRKGPLTTSQCKKVRRKTPLCLKLCLYKIKRFPTPFPSLLRRTE